MNNAYEIIQNSFNQKYIDVLFPPKLLDELNDEERKEVEGKLINCCFHGVEASYQYIQYLKCHKIDEVFNDENMSKVEELDRIKIYKELYKFTKDIKYINKLLELSKLNPHAYSYLTFIYMFYEGDKVFLYQELEKLSNISGIYKEMFEKRCKTEFDFSKYM